MNHQQQCSVCDRTGIPLHQDYVTGKRGHLCQQCMDLVKYAVANGWWIGRCLKYLGMV